MISRWAAVLCFAAVAVGACAPGSSPANILVLGVMLPLSGPTGSLAREELNGIQVAIDRVNHSGGVQGRQVRLETRDVPTREATTGAVASLKSAGATVVMGTYESSLSIPAAHATSAAGLAYWETGAVADQVTGEGLAHVFRVGAAGSNLGKGSAVFAAQQLAPRLGKAPSQLRVTVVEVDDAYGRSVASAAFDQAHQLGFTVTGPISYVAWHPDWNRVFGFVTASQPDILIMATHVPDGIEFRKQMIARGVHVAAVIGSTMAECGPDFGKALGQDAIGIFASDRPTAGFNAGVLDPSALTAYNSLVAAYRQRFKTDPGEEAISGFSSAWALTTRAMANARSLDTAGISASAMAQDMPQGSLPNGGGLKFGSGATDLGQNLRSASVIWQWQGVRQSVTVWPAVFATGQIEMVPLPR